MGYIDFLEAFARAADCISPPLEEDCEEYLREVRDNRGEAGPFGFVHEYHQGLRSKTGVTKKALMIQRPSADFCTVKTRPVQDKLEATLNLIMGGLCLYHNCLGTSELLQKFKHKI